MDLRARPGEHTGFTFAVAQRAMKADGIVTSALLRYIHFVWKSARGWSTANLLLILCQGGLPLAALYLTKLAVDSVVQPYVDGGQFDATLVLFFIGLLGLASLLEAAAGSTERYVRAYQEALLSDYMCNLLHAKSSEIDLEYYENQNYHDTLHRAQKEAPARPSRVLAHLRELVHHCVALLAVGSLLVWLHWGVVSILVAAALPGTLLRIRHARRLYSWESQKTPTEREAANLSSILTGAGYAKEIRLFNLASFFIERFNKLQAEVRRQRSALAAKKALADVSAHGVLIVISSGLLAYLALQTVEGTLTVGDLVMFYAAVQRCQYSLNQILSSGASLYEDNLFLGNFFRFLDLTPRLQEPVLPRQLIRPIKTGLVLDHVSFSYPGDPTPVLADITLTIRPGERIALVGENGAGKSTLVKLLCRLYDPSRGAIRLDGIDLREYSAEALRRHISVIFQDYARYQLTARENIWLGNTSVPLHGLQVTRAARKAKIDNVIAHLGNGYDTRLGKSFEQGDDLSAGEWQKVALARAFLRDADIIILDEPGSALDAKAEFEIFEQFHKLVEGRTAILISHRLSTVKLADRIFVLDCGRIAESGTHDQLLRRNGKYAWMFELQARRYR